MRQEYTSLNWFRFTFAALMLLIFVTFAFGQKQSSSKDNKTDGQSYQWRGKLPNFTSKTNISKANTNNTNGRWCELGITIWKLREKTSRDNGVFLTSIEKGLKVDYVLERIEANTTLKIGDKIRLTIESPRNSFLYIINRVQNEDGTFGKPTLIFPNQLTRDRQNQVSAGVLIDLPSQDESFPYFVITSATTNEFLSFIISEKPIIQLQMTKGAFFSLESDKFEEWLNSWSINADIYNLDTGVGDAWTVEERDAGKITGISLTQENPTPQTIYRGWSANEKQILVSILLKTNPILYEKTLNQSQQLQANSNPQSKRIKINSTEIFQKRRNTISQQKSGNNQSNIEKQSAISNESFIENGYRSLSNNLITENRLPEAQITLDLLKKKEYKQISVQKINEPANLIPYSQAEADVIAKIENLVALERERTELQKLLSTNGELSAEQNNKLAKLNLDIAAANKAFDVALDALGKAEASATTRVDEIKGGKVLQSALTELSEKTNSGVVALYTVLGTEEEKDASGKPIKDKFKSKFGWVIMVTENRYTAYPIDVENLEETVFQFRAALSSDKYNPQPLAEKIYTAIFRQTSPKLKKTLEQDLQEYLKLYKDKTLMWSLDGVLRYIPMAALHDGKQYLVENYRNTVFTKESFLWLMNSYENNWKALGLGVSDKRPNFSALPGVKTELETIVREPEKQTGILNGSIKLNDNFKKQTFFNIVNAGAFPVVHISSHYSFDAAKPENSFLLAGDGNLTFAEIKQQQNLFKKVDLLTLSACDTGVSGNGKEAEGFAYLAQSLGAKSVIASLWKVSDAGTPELMTRFYQLRKDNPQMSKGEAFRRAQLSLLGSQAKDAVSPPTAKVETKVTNPNQKRTDVFDLSGKTIELPLFVKDKQKPFAHPHYWASFVLIGNWR